MVQGDGLEKGMLRQMSNIKELHNGAAQENPSKQLCLERGLEIGTMGRLRGNVAILLCEVL